MFDGGNLWRMKEDNSGLEFAFTDEILKDYNNLFTQLFPDINLEPHTPQGQIITYLVECDTKTIATVQDLANYFFLGGSNGLLDIWAYNQYRAKRKDAITGTVLMTIQGLANSKVAKGFTVSDGLTQYELQNDITLSDDGAIKVIFVATQTTTQVSLPNTVTQIITPLSNVERVNNDEPSTPGVLRESDTLFYQRCQKYGSLFKNSSFQSIMSNVAQVTGVSKIGGFENVSNNEITERNYTLVPHSFVIVVLGGNEDEIATTIANCKPPGAAMNGNTAVKVNINNKEITYKFERPKEAQISFYVECLLNINSPHSYAQFVREAIKKYIDELEIGDLITQPNLSKAIVNYINGFEIVDVKISRFGGQPSYNSIQLDLNEIAIALNSNIFIEGKDA